MIAYLGTPELAVAPLRALHAAGHEIALVVSAPDRRRGRGPDLSPSPVKAAAIELGLPVSADPDDLLEVDVDLGVVVAYGRILRSHLLDAMPFVNLHFSLLPRWRGAAPVERAILAGDGETGVCLMQITEGLDEGGVYARATTDVDAKTLEQLRGELVDLGTGLLLDALVHGLGEPEPQVGEVTYAAKLATADRFLDPARPAFELARVVRLGGAWTTVRGKRLMVLVAEERDGVLVPTLVQPEGRSPMPFEAWARGARPAPGELFDQ